MMNNGRNPGTGQRSRSENTFRFLAWRRPLSFLSIGLLTIAVMWVLNRYGLDKNVSNNVRWTSSCFIYLLNAPMVIVMIAFLLPMNMGASKNLPKGEVRHFRKLYLSIVTRGTNPEAVARGCIQMRKLQDLDPRIRICIVTDEPNDKLFQHLDVDIVATPSSYSPKKALYKARALEWFRTSFQLHDEDWVLHLDEETVIDEHTVKACIQFIQEEKEYDFGQGIILYNAHNFWKHTLPTIADIPRARDDYGQFFLAPSFIHAPFLGMHGSFLLMSGKVQNMVGWDTDCAAEDAWFGLEAWRLNFKIGWIPSIVREQSPNSIFESWRQRSRWFGGMPKILGVYGKIKMLLWILETVGTPILIATWRSLRLPYWMYVLLIVTNVTDFWSMTFACLVQDIDAQIGIWRIAFHAICYPAAAVVSKWLEGLVILYTIVRPPKGFYIVAK